MMVLATYIRFSNRISVKGFVGDATNPLRASKAAACASSGDSLLNRLLTAPLQTPSPRFSASQGAKIAPLPV